MPDIINSNFDPRLPFPLDVRQQVQNMNALFMIPATSRWEGMVVYVRSAELPYILRGGTDNTFWQPFEFNGGGGLLPNGIVVYGEAQQSGNDVLLNDGWVWRINQVDYQSSDDTIAITPAASGNLRVDIIVGNASSEFVKLVGTEVAGPGPAVEPNIPADTVPLVRVDVNDTGIVAIEDFVLSAFVRYDINDQNLNPAHRQNARTNIQAVSKDTDDTRTGGLTNEGKVTVDLDEASAALPIVEIKQQGVTKHVFTGDEARIIPHLLRVNSPIAPTVRGASFRGSTNGGDPVFEIQNAAGTKIFYPRGTGGIGQLRSNASDESIRRDENYLTFPATVAGTGKLNDVALADGVGMVKFAATVTEVSGIVSNNSDQKELLVWTDNTDGITLTEQDTDSVAANRFLRQINVPYRTPVRIVYESSTGRWVNVMKVGEDLFYPVKNQTGANIPKGTAVRFAGALGASGRLLIQPFLADGTFDSRDFMGVTAEAISNGEDGKVLWFGRIRGIDTSTFAEGDILYASPTVAGGFTATKPTFPENIISVAAVITAATNGTIFVRPRTEFLQGGGNEFYIPAFDANGNLVERTWRIDANGVLIATGQSGIITIRNILSGEDVHAILANIYLKSTGIIFNTATNNPVPGSNSRYSKSGSFIFANPDTDTNDIFVKYMYSASSLFTAWKKLLVSLGTSGQVGFYNSAGQVIGDSGFSWDNVNKRLGVGTATPSYSAHVRRSGNARVYCETSSDNGLAYVGTISDVANVQLAAFGSNYPAPWAGKSGVYLDPGQNDFNVWFGNKLVSAIDNNGNTRASTFYSEKITVTLSTNGVDVDVKTFAATDKKIFRATAIPTDNTDLYALADFSKLYDGTNSVFRRTSLAGSNMSLDVDGLNGTKLQARATSATGENKEIEVSIIYYV